MGYGTARRKPVPAGLPRLFRRSRTCGASHEAAGKFPVDSLLFTGPRGAPHGPPSRGWVVFSLLFTRRRGLEGEFVPAPALSRYRGSFHLCHLMVRSARKRASRTMGRWLRARPSPVLRDAAFGRSSGRGRASGERVLEGELVAAAGALRDAEKQLVERDAPLDQALLLREADQG